MPEQALGKGRYLISREVPENRSTYNSFIKADQILNSGSKLKSTLLTNVLDYLDGQMYGEIHV